MNVPTPAPAVPTVCLVGIGGFGERHLDNVRRLEAAGRLRLTCTVDPRNDGGRHLGDRVAMYRTLAEAAAAGERPDIAIVSTPIDTHHHLAADALRLGADVLVEKPPTATLEQYESLRAVARSEGRRVQVGFQSLGSHALPAIEALLASGRIGRLRAVGATGLWLRTAAYYGRSPWAGHRVLDGIQVVDGVVTNPLAHAVMTALHVAGARGAADVAELETELLHANDISADDTSVVRVRTADGIPVTCALTLCASSQEDPHITIEGTLGRAVLHYTRDELAVTVGGGETTAEHFGRTDLLENLIDVRSGAAEALLSPLDGAGAFMRVLEAVRTAADPAAIEPELLEYAGEGPGRHPVIPGIAGYVARAVKSQSTFSSLSAPWAADPATAETLRVGGTEVARVRLGSDIAPTNAPRPFLHPVRTLSGTVVSDQQPLDHPWHLGVGIALQDVAGTNFWGGRTYVRGAGYVWREDHGRIERTRSGFDGGALEEDLSWIGHDGVALLTERRTTRAAPAGDGAWELCIDFTLSPAGDSPVALGSPGSNGRENGGYGGFFWRLPAVGRPEVFTATEAGEEAAHGSSAPWLAFVADFGPERAEATLVFAADDADPWFVRCGGYPGVGRSLAWDRPVVTAVDAPVRRSVRVLVADGRMDRSRIASLLAAGRVDA